MTTRRSRGDGGLYWSKTRNRWIAEITIGYRPNGKRITKTGSGETKTAAKDKLREILRDYEDGITTDGTNYTVKDAVTYWLTYGLNNRSESTIKNYKWLADTHITPDLGARKLRKLSAEDIDKWLLAKAKTLSTRSVHLLHSILNRSIKSAQARDKVKRNVVILCEVPTGQPGRPSKSLNLDQAIAVLAAAKASSLQAYIVLSILIGARTEELRALTWDHIDLDGKPKNNPPLPPSVKLWSSVRAGGDTKTRRSRRTLAMPSKCVAVLHQHKRAQNVARALAGNRWHNHGLVFASQIGTPLDAHNVRREFRRVAKDAGLNAGEWTPRELRHSFVSLLSDNGMQLEDISRLVGHDGTATTDTVYRHQLQPVLNDGAIVMDHIFRERGNEGGDRDL